MKSIIDRMLIARAEVLSVWPQQPIAFECGPDVLDEIRDHVASVEDDPAVWRGGAVGAFFGLPMHQRFVLASGYWRIIGRTFGNEMRVLREGAVA